MKGFKHKQGIDQYGIPGFLKCMVFHPCYTLFPIAGESVMESEEITERSAQNKFEKRLSLQVSNMRNNHSLVII